MTSAASPNGNKVVDPYENDSKVNYFQGKSSYPSSSSLQGRQISSQPTGQLTLDPFALMHAQAVISAKEQQNLALDNHTALVEQANTSGYRKSIEDKLYVKINDALALASSNWSSARETLFDISKVSEVHYSDVKLKALHHFIELLQRDPHNDKSSKGLVKLAVNLVKLLETSNSQQESPYVQVLLATACGDVLGLINHHHKLKNINAVTQVLQDKQYLTKRDLFKLNVIKDLELHFAISMIQEGIARLTTDATRLDKIIAFSTNLGNAIGGLYNKEVGNAFISLKSIVDDIGKNLSDSWYDAYVVAKDLSQNVLKNANIDNLCAILYMINENKSYKLKAAGAQLLGQIAALSKSPLIRKIAIEGAQLSDGKKVISVPGLSHYTAYDHHVKKALIKSDDDKAKDLTVRIYSMNAVAKLMLHADQGVALWARETMRTLFRDNNPDLPVYVQRSISDPTRVLDFLKGNTNVFPLPLSMIPPRSPSTSKETNSSNSNSPVSQVYLSSVQQHTPPSPPSILSSPTPPGHSISLKTAPVTAFSATFQWPSEFLKLLVPCLTFAQGTKIEDVAQQLIKGLSAGKFIIQPNNEGLLISVNGMKELTELLKKLPVITLDFTSLKNNVKGLDTLAQALPETMISHVALACPIERTEAALFAQAVETVMNKGRTLSFTPSNSPIAMARLAQALGKLGYQNLEKAYYTKAIEMWGNSVKSNSQEINDSLGLIYGCLGNLLSIDGELNKAIEYLEISVRINPQSNTMSNLAQDYAKKADIFYPHDLISYNRYEDMAIQLSQEILKTHPDFVEFRRCGTYIRSKLTVNGTNPNQIKAAVIGYFQKAVELGKIEKAAKEKANTQLKSVEIEALEAAQKDLDSYS